MERLLWIRRALVPGAAVIAIGCSPDSPTQSKTTAGGASGTSQSSEAGASNGRSTASGGIATVPTRTGGSGASSAGWTFSSGTGGTSLMSMASGQTGGSGTAWTTALGNGGTSTLATSAAGSGAVGASSTKGGGASGSGTAAASASGSGGATKPPATGGIGTGSTSAGGTGAAATAAGGSSGTTSSLSVGGVSATTAGSPAKGGQSGNAAGGTTAAGSSPGSTAGSAALPADYLVNGSIGRVAVMADPSQSSGARVTAVFYDGPMRMDAFAPYPPELHEVTLKKDACVLTTAATRACNPPCGSSEYCGKGNQCKPAAAVVSAGTVTVDGAAASVTLTAANSTYSGAAFPIASIASGVTLAVRANGDVIPAFSLSSTGVDVAGVGLPASGSTIELIDGQDKVVTWSPTGNGIVQLLLNTGWHGAPPTATLLCEAPAAAGRLVIPRTIVEAFPLVSGAGMSHTSTVLLLERKSAVVNGSTIELLIVGYRGVIFPIH